MKFYAEVALVSALSMGALALLGMLIWSMQPLKTPPNLQTILHLKTIDGKPNPCPPGYALVKAIFTERDGTSEDAWVFRNALVRGSVTVDYLKGGESISMALQFMLPGSPDEIPEGKRL